jgi:cell division protease FtsH
MAPFNGFGKRAPSDKPPVLTSAETAQLQRTAAEAATARLAGGAHGGSANGGPNGSDAPVESPTPPAEPGWSGPLRRSDDEGRR